MRGGRGGFLAQVRAGARGVPQAEPVIFGATGNPHYPVPSTNAATGTPREIALLETIKRNSRLTLASLPHAPAAFDQPNPHDVRIYSPRTQSELWANSAILSDASPYFKDLFTSGFAEASMSEPTEVGKGRRADDIDSDELEFEGSDDEREKEWPPRKAGVISPGGNYHEAIVREATYSTYRAVLGFIYTGQIEFATLHSVPPPPPSPFNFGQLSNPKPDSASPKSIYRLADFLSLPTVKALALTAIRRNLSSANVATELYGDVSRVYDEVQKLELEFAVQNWSAVDSSAAMLEIEHSLPEAPGAGVISHQLARATCTATGAHLGAHHLQPDTAGPAAPRRLLVRLVNPPSPSPGFTCRNPAMYQHPLSLDVHLFFPSLSLDSYFRLRGAPLAVRAAICKPLGRFSSEAFSEKEDCHSSREDSKAKTASFRELPLLEAPKTAPFTPSPGGFPK